MGREAPVEGGEPCTGHAVQFRRGLGCARGLQGTPPASRIPLGLQWCPHQVHVKRRMHQRWGIGKEQSAE